MKKYLVLLLSIFIVTGIIGCSSNNEQKNRGLGEPTSIENSNAQEPPTLVTEKQNIILQYINEDLPVLLELETAYRESYTTALDGDSSTDAELYTELQTTVLLARNLTDKAIEIAQELTDEEVLDAHKLYIDYASKNLSAISIMMAAIEKQDSTYIADANEKLTEASISALDFKAKVIELAKKYDIILNTIEVEEG